MRVTGICRDCRYRWQMGAKGQQQHLWCCKESRIVKNTKMKSCSHYDRASDDEIQSKRKRGCGGIGR